MNAINNMHKSKDVQEFIMNTLSTSVVGNRPGDRFQIWTGTGANGKTLQKNLVATAFGGYYYEPSSTIFATRSISGNCLSPEIAKLKGKRIVITSESESGDKLRAGLIKQCSGQDTIQARDLYQPATEFKCQANIVMMFNEVPGIEDTSGGIERRLDMIHFGNKFVESPRRPNEKQIDKTLQKKFQSKEYGACFLKMLIDRFLTHGFNFEIPDKVQQDAKSYLGDNDVLGPFMESLYEETDNEDDYVYLKDIWNEFRIHPISGQLKFERSQDLSGKLKAKYQYDRISNNVIFRYLKRK
jgi:putative DNA primase/helicase